MSSFRYQFAKITSPDLPKEEDLNREAELADVHIFINASTVELTAIRNYSVREKKRIICSLTYSFTRTNH